MRRRQLRVLLKRLKKLQQMKFSSVENLLLKLGQAKGEYPRAWRLIDIDMPKLATLPTSPNFSFGLNRQKLRTVRRREGRYLLRSNLCGREPAELWQFYIQLVEIEGVFKNLKDDLKLRPIYHQLENRIEAHIFLAFIAYCLQVTLRARLKSLASGLTARGVLEKCHPDARRKVSHHRWPDFDPLPLHRAEHRTKNPLRETQARSPATTSTPYQRS